MGRDRYDLFYELSVLLQFARVTFVVHVFVDAIE
jgi:hypothetical protein